MPGTGLMTLGAAALFGISTVLRTETSDKAFRVNEVQTRLSCAACLCRVSLVPCLARCRPSGVWFNTIDGSMPSL
jgi:hypothetical protein